jgi:hypothetical protein
LFVDFFLDAHARVPGQITLDLDATDDPLHGHQEGRFFHGYYDGYCYLPLYIFCGRHRGSLSLARWEPVLTAKLRRSNIDASAGTVEELIRIIGRIRARWPRVRVLLRGDSGFCREALMHATSASRPLNADVAPRRAGAITSSAWCATNASARRSRQR